MATVPTLTFSRVWGTLGDYDGETVQVIVLTGDVPATVANATVSEFTAYEIDNGYTRPTFLASFDLVGGRKVLNIADGENPTCDTTDATPSAILFAESGVADASAGVISIAAISEGAGFADWPILAPNGFASVGRLAVPDPSAQPEGSPLLANGAGGFEWGTPGSGGGASTLAEVSVEANSTGMFDQDTVGEAIAEVGGFFGLGSNRQAAISDTLSGALAGRPGGEPTDGAKLVDNVSVVTAASLAVAESAQGLAIDGGAAASGADAVALRAIDGPSTERKFVLCSGSSGHFGQAWTTPAITFADGYWWDAVIVIDESTLPASPVHGSQNFSELFTQTHDSGVGDWDNIEDAVRSTYDADLGRWRHTCFHEQTLAGGTYDDGFRTPGVASRGGVEELPAGVPFHLAAWLEFDRGDGKGQVRFFRKSTFGRADLIDGDGGRWRCIYQYVASDILTIDTCTEDMAIGCTNGDSARIDKGKFTLRDTFDGTILASPDPALAYAEGDGEFTDLQGKVWTPGPESATVAGESPSSGGSGPDPYDLDPEPPGAADPGASVDYARGDHVHAPPTAGQIGAIAAAGSAVTLWLGNQAAYDAIGSPSASTVYVVTP